MIVDYLRKHVNFSFFTLALQLMQSYVKLYTYFFIYLQIRRQYYTYVSFITDG